MTTPTVQPSYGAFNAITLSLAPAGTGLASSSSLVAGRESTALVNTTPYEDVELEGYIKVGTSPTANTLILIYAFAALTDAPAWPDVFSGADAAATLTSAGIGQGFLKLVAALNVDTTNTGRVYPFSCASLLDVFRARAMPKNWSLFVTHNTGAALDTTGGNHVIKYRGFNTTIPSI